MTYEQLHQQLTALLPEGFELVSSPVSPTFSLKIDGEYFCFQEPPETILWAVRNPEEYQSQQDREIEELLADLSATVEG